MLCDICDPEFEWYCNAQNGSRISLNDHWNMRLSSQGDFWATISGISWNFQELSLEFKPHTLLIGILSTPNFPNIGDFQIRIYEFTQCALNILFKCGLPHLCGLQIMIHEFVQYASKKAVAGYPRNKIKTKKMIWYMFRLI